MINTVIVIKVPQEIQGQYCSKNKQEKKKHQMVQLTLGSISSVEMHRLTVLFTTSSNIKWTKLRGKNNAAFNRE